MALREATAAFGAGPGMLAAVTAPWYRRLDLKLLAASLVIAVGVVLVVFAVARSVTGDEASNLPDAIESVSPATDAVQVLQQSQVVVDLAEGYEGRLIIDDLALPTIRLDELASVDVAPGEQVEVPPGVVFEPGNGTLTFIARRRVDDRALRTRLTHRHRHLLAHHRRRVRRPLLHLVLRRDLMLGSSVRSRRCRGVW